jgi:hypothetical protein
MLFLSVLCKQITAPFLISKSLSFICQEKNETIQSQLDYYSKRQKFQKMNATDKADVSAPPMINGLQNSPGVQCFFFFFFLQGMVVSCFN